MSCCIANSVVSNMVMSRLVKPKCRRHGTATPEVGNKIRLRENVYDTLLNQGRILF